MLFSFCKNCFFFLLQFLGPHHLGLPEQLAHVSLESAQDGACQFILDHKAAFFVIVSGWDSFVYD